MDIKSSSVHYHYPRKEDLGVALVERYSQRFFDTLAKASIGATKPKEKLRAYRSVYRMALVEDDAVCLCGLLGAEMAGLPDALSQGVQSFFNANIEWVMQALPDSLSEKQRRKKASAIVATHQGAMMLATSLDDRKLFDTVTKHLIDIELDRD